MQGPKLSEMTEKEKEEYEDKIKNMDVQKIQLEELKDQNLIKCSNCWVIAPDFDFLILPVCRHYLCTSCVTDTMKYFQDKKIKMEEYPCPCKLGWSTKQCQ